MPGHTADINAKPHTQNPSTLNAKMARFVEITWAAFFARHKPVTTKANPACIKTTSIPAKSSNVMLNDTIHCWVKQGKCQRREEVHPGCNPAVGGSIWHNPTSFRSSKHSLFKFRQRRRGYLVLCLRYQNSNKKLITHINPSPSNRGNVRNRLFHNCGACKRRYRPAS